MSAASRPPSFSRDGEPREVRAGCRSGEFRGGTSGFCPGYMQANLIALPHALAGDFADFCRRNPCPCPLLAVSDTPVLRTLSPGADLRTDLPRYRVYRRGELIREASQVQEEWESGLTAFLLGCSFGFEAALATAGIRLRHQDEGRVVPMYITDRPNVPAGAFSGRLVVSMRPIREDQVAEACRISGEQPLAHGAPIHAGNPAALGIRDLSRADFGEPGGLLPGEVPVFWACGVTSQVAALGARPDVAISHAPGHMFVTDVPVVEQRRGSAGQGRCQAA